MKIKSLFTIIILFLLLVPVATLFADGIVPCGGAGEDPCDFNYALILVNNIINFLLYTFAVPVATVMFAYAGWLFLSAAGDSGQVTRAKSITWSVVVGLVIALAAWLIVNTITSSLLSDEFKRAGFWFL